MTGANGIASHVFQKAYLADEGGLVDGCTQRSEVVMQADTLDFPGHSVELEARFRHADRANAEALLLAVVDKRGDFAATFASYREVKCVKSRRLGAPTMRLFHRNGQFVQAGRGGWSAE